MSLTRLGVAFPADGADCNRNGNDDTPDMGDEVVPDCNGNGIPDPREVPPVHGLPVPIVIPSIRERPYLAGGDFDGGGLIY